VIVVPPPSSKPAPLLLVTHGAGDRPEPDCARYEELTKKAAFVVCLRGRAMNALVPLEERRYFYDGHIELGKEVVSAIHAVGAAYGDRVDVTGITFAGYSQGAAMGILYLERGGARDTHVRRVLLVEGGSGEFSAAIAEALKEDGVDRVAMVCGQASCHERADRSVRWMKKAGLAVSSTFAPGAGHTSGGAVHPLVDEAWSWLVDGDTRFATR
jgi:pimeloyl-ACP methyl ester carboxylesterase